MDEIARRADVSPSRLAILDQRRLGPSDIFMINSTSGTTGLPKCVKMCQNRWFAFTRWEDWSFGLNAEDIIMTPLAPPFGFGLMQSHFVPASVGATTVILDRFDPEVTLQLIQRERATVLVIVPTEIIMILNCPNFDRYDLSSLRVCYEGGEAIPYHRGVEFEERARCIVVQGFGSNEAGLVSFAKMSNTREQRLLKAGHALPVNNVRLFGQDGEEVRGPGAIGQPGSNGPMISAGYLNDPEANKKLFTKDGWVLTGDLATIEDGFLAITGRVADFIVRGGHNISAIKLEAEIDQHPAVAMVGVVGMPDPTFGEKACAYVTLKEGQKLSLEDLCAFLLERGITKHWLPERLEILDAMPISVGDKVSKAELRKDIKRKVDLEVSAVK